MMTHANSLHLREAGSLINCRSLTTKTIAHTGLPARTLRSRLPPWAATAELAVINVVTQHNPQPNPQLPRRRDSSLRDAFLDELAPVETLQFHILPDRMQGGFAPEKPQERIPFLLRAEPLPRTTGVFTRDHPHVAGQRFRVWTAVHAARRVMSAHC